MDHNKVLKDILQKVADEQKYENCEIYFCKTSSGGANYTSHLYLATISSPDKDDLRLFAKVAAIGDKMRSATPIRIFQIENFFYTKLKKIYEDLEEKHGVPSEHRIVTAKFYAADDKINFVPYKEALVLEDLTIAGYQSYDRFKPFTWEYAQKSVINLAKLHALSIAWSVYDPITFEESADILKTEHNVAAVMDYFQNVVEIVLEVTRKENKERLKKFIEHISWDKDFHKFQKPLRRPVVAYGDYRPSNLMHKEHEDGTIEIISLDYQTLQIGNPVVDLMYFIFNGSDKEFRKNHFKETIELYYKELKEALQRLDVNPKTVYSREDFDFEVEQILPFGLILSIFCLLIVTVEAEDAPKVDENIEIKDFAVSPSTLYIERMNDIVDDFIDMGII